MRWGENLEFVAEARTGGSIYVPHLPIKWINASPDESLEGVLVRGDGDAVAVNLDIEQVEKPENVAWIDLIHRGSSLRQGIARCGVDRPPSAASLDVTFSVGLREG